MGQRKIVLANGTELTGTGFGSNKEAIAKVVFNTAMVGYQEILSDPCTIDQILVMTYPLIGNYGIIDEDYDSKVIGPKGLVVREYNDKPSNFRYTKTLNECLEENDVVGISHVDTRKLTRILRDEGNMIGLICDIDKDHETAMNQIRSYQQPTDSVMKVSCKKKWYSRCANPKYSVAILDGGVKFGLIRELNRLGCNVTVVPYNMPVEKIKALNSDGIIVAGGPGHPNDAMELVENVMQLQGNSPVLGIGVGMEWIALANNVEIHSMKTGHHGGNHPIRIVDTNKIEIVNFNHDTTVDKESLIQSGATITHIHLLDDTVAGFTYPEKQVSAVQFDLDATCNPNHTNEILKQFLEAMKGGKKDA